MFYRHIHTGCLYEMVQDYGTSWEGRCVLDFDCPGNLGEVRHLKSIHGDDGKQWKCYNSRKRAISNTIKSYLARN